MKVWQALQEAIQNKKKIRKKAWDYPEYIYWCQKRLAWFHNDNNKWDFLHLDFDDNDEWEVLGKEDLYIAPALIRLSRPWKCLMVSPQVFKCVEEAIDFFQGFENVTVEFWPALINEDGYYEI